MALRTLRRFFGNQLLQSLHNYFVPTVPQTLPYIASRRYTVGYIEHKEPERTHPIPSIRIIPSRAFLRVQPDLDNYALHRYTIVHDASSSPILKPKASLYDADSGDSVKTSSMEWQACIQDTIENNNLGQIGPVNMEPECLIVPVLTEHKCISHRRIESIRKVNFSNEEVLCFNNHHSMADVVYTESGDSVVASSLQREILTTETIENSLLRNMTPVITERARLTVSTPTGDLCLADRTTLDVDDGSSSSSEPKIPYEDTLWSNNSHSIPGENNLSALEGTQAQMPFDEILNSLELAKSGINFRALLEAWEKNGLLETDIDAVPPGHYENLDQSTSQAPPPTYRYDGGSGKESVVANISNTAESETDTDTDAYYRRPPRKPREYFCGTICSNTLRESQSRASSVARSFSGNSKVEPLRADVISVAECLNENVNASEACAIKSKVCRVCSSSRSGLTTALLKTSEREPDDLVKPNINAKALRSTSFTAVDSLASEATFLACTDADIDEGASAPPRIPKTDGVSVSSASLSTVIMPETDSDISEIYSAAVAAEEERASECMDDWTPSNNLKTRGQTLKNNGLLRTDTGLSAAAASDAFKTDGRPGSSLSKIMPESLDTDSCISALFDAAVAEEQALASRSTSYGFSSESSQSPTSTSCLKTDFKLSKRTNLRVARRNSTDTSIRSTVLSWEPPAVASSRRSPGKGPEVEDETIMDTSSRTICVSGSSEAGSIVSEMEFSTESYANTMSDAESPITCTPTPSTTRRSRFQRQISFLFRCCLGRK